jgi:hypothetical protein
LWTRRHETEIGSGVIVIAFDIEVLLLNFYCGLSGLAHAGETEGIKLEGISEDVAVALGGVREYGDHGTFGEKDPVFGSEIVDHDFADDGAIAEGVDAEGFAEDTIGADKSGEGGFGPLWFFAHYLGDFVSNDGDGVVFLV